MLASTSHLNFYKIYSVVLSASINIYPVRSKKDVDTDVKVYKNDVAHRVLY